MNIWQQITPYPQTESRECRVLILSSFPPFFKSGILDHRVVLPILRIDLPPSFKPFLKDPLRHIQRCVSMVLLNSKMFKV